MDEIANRALEQATAFAAVAERAVMAVLRLVWLLDQHGDREGAARAFDIADELAAEADAAHDQALAAILAAFAARAG